MAHNPTLESLHVFRDLLVGQGDLVLERVQDICDLPLIHAKRYARVVRSEHMGNVLDIPACFSKSYYTMVPLAPLGKIKSAT